MGYLTLAMQRFIWLLYRLFGVACLVLALHYVALTLQLDGNYIPRSEQLPYFAVCLALFTGAMVLLPSTTPLWVKDVQDPGTAAASIAALIALAMALVAGVPVVLPLYIDGPLDEVLRAIGAAINVVTAAGVLAAGFLGCTAPRRRGKPVPVDEESASAQAHARLLRQSRA